MILNRGAGAPPGDVPLFLAPTVSRETSEEMSREISGLQGMDNGQLTGTGGSKDGQPDHEHGGLVTRCCPFLLNSIDAEWKMLVLGFLFGLGFETPSEVALLGAAAAPPLGRRWDMG